MRSKIRSTVKRVTVNQINCICFADILYNELANIIIYLLKSDSILGAVYLDPCFLVLLSKSQKVQGCATFEKYLEKITILRDIDFNHK